MVTTGQIQAIIPYPVLDDLATIESDIDNDIQIVLDWMSPTIPSTFDPKFSLPKYKEPSHRVRSAIKSCLKDQEDQFRFMNIYLNSVNLKLWEFTPKDFTFVDYIDFIKLLAHHLDQVNLNKTSLFNDKFQTILTLYLSKKTDFFQHLREFFDKSLFQNHAPTALNLHDVVSTLVSVGLSDYLNEIVVELAITKIRNFTLQVCTGNWERPLLHTINSYIENEIYPSFSLVTESNLTQELVKLAHGVLVTQRIKEIYPLVAAYPYSENALVELQICLSEANREPASSRSELVKHFIEGCQKNLLHAGVNTVDVIITYTKTIKSFLLIDPRGVLLDKVVRPIRKYLKSREDIFTKLVHGLLDTSPSNKLIELAQQLNNSGRSEKQKCAYHDLSWIPDPFDALPDFKREKVSDIIESLLSIFESKEIFIQEFTNLFGKQLIESRHVNEIDSKLDVLKLRFGKNSFTTLDIMIRDFKNSPSQFGILSHLYWTTLLDGTDFKVPKEMESVFQDFQEKHKKEGRILKLVPSLGTVKLKLDLKNGESRLFEVSPEKAAIVLQFNEKENERSVYQIAETLNMPSFMVNEGLAYWVKEGILIALTPSLYIAE
ncbi:hypothetical protein KGF56_004288 [Candida oxycetoniae]|uniref:Cullin family profile domain-containing protein n=1 Tax=Candida oxycetoniae TaxID=497107 RepID=A0AAI9WWA4_9ASCO|nr:uncharacterized protein KGF56_004288 [Candida oxycetoniae]KAI3402827.2 hypothetical protein KGF56_004288 [Candida oxycetoniae]